MSDLENAVARLREWMQATYPQDFALYPDQGSPIADVQAVLAELAETQELVATKQSGIDSWASIVNANERWIGALQAKCDALQARVERLKTGIRQALTSTSDARGIRAVLKAALAEKGTP